ncbi:MULTISPECIES: hypothetical protein [Streptomyces]|uniref:Uncharacterized protein n=1 Tax=Streptomyces lonegramiae TaxID=3075524 RepID=A0ABU2XK93_9ACTN|nr:hypothetical protein [Streptomyces sp. DSM 41529]MDT0546350.1 hypothetical protein [Streptomyces sp. DSM 41529]
MDAVVQWVRTEWTKTSRGGTEAARRNAAPLAFPLPPGLASAVHEVVMREADAFEPHTSVRELPDPGVALREAGGLLRVRPPEASLFSMPRRHRRPPAVRLGPGEWLRWRINYRFVGFCGGEWSYRLDTLNVAYGPAAPDVFLGSPTRRVDERAYLR